MNKSAEQATSKEEIASDLFDFPHFYGKLNDAPVRRPWWLFYVESVKGRIAISTSNFRVNDQIRNKEVRLIGPEGENLGVVATRKAMQIAQDAELDLVEVAPNAEPPVCRVMDYGKFLYERTKKEREARKSQTQIEIKEIRLRPKTNEHHRGFKTKDARGWLEDGKKVRVTIRFRGREVHYPEIALEDLREIAEELSDISKIEQAPQMEGRNMSMMLVPQKQGK
ncbi:MAG: translation initiation factor IF-3 [Anaerolineae bacterium]|jgi:translation initiation factor IF-3|nr:translation initiation factor IF-3 [Anaerolineae bacterium]